MPVQAYAVGGAANAVQFGDGGSVVAAGSRGSAEVVDRIAVVSMAGIAAEVIACGDAEGGLSDLAALREVSRLANPCYSRREGQDGLARWGTLMALTLLQKNSAALNALAATLEAGGSVADCVLAIEACESG